MKVSEIYKMEENNRDGCFLFKDGIFWRAWERSAMFFHEFIKPYEVTKRYFKGLNTEMVYLGFPDKVLSNILEICNLKGFNTEKNDQLIKICGCDPIAGYEEWKSNVCVVPKAVTGGVHECDNIIILQERIVEDVIQRISGYPLAGKTPMECQQFLHELQNLINGTI